MGPRRNTCFQKWIVDCRLLFSGDWTTSVSWFPSSSICAEYVTAPEYALDSTLSPANDLYSLGCVLYAVHMGGRPPFRNRGSMQSLRENCEGSLVRREWARGSKWDRCSSELRGKPPFLLSINDAERARPLTPVTHETSATTSEPRLITLPLLLLLLGHINSQLSRFHDIRFKA